MKTLNAGETCTPDCADGFRPVDAVCGAEGALTAVADCEQITCPASEAPANAVEEGEVEYCLGPLAAGDKCTPNCKVGYTAVDAECSAEGELTKAECVQITCDASTPPDYAKQQGQKASLGECSASLAAGSKCTPECEDGYTAVAAECSMTGDLTAARCDGVQITCPASDDGAPLNVLQTESAETCVKTLNAGETCTPDCADGFRPVDAVCGAEGALTAASTGL